MYRNHINLFHAIADTLSLARKIIFINSEAFASHCLENVSEVCIQYYIQSNRYGEVSMPLSDNKDIVRYIESKNIKCRYSEDSEVLS